MEILTKDDFFTNTAVLSRKLRNSIFVYPTDTIYGIGCDATNPDLVKRIRELKERESQPFSIIAPSKEWILENCETFPTALRWLNKLPGAYTLIMKLRQRDCIAENLAPNLDSVGIRIPNHWISNLVRELDFPIVTTSANKHGMKFMKRPEDLSPELKKGIDILFDEGTLEGVPSTLVHLEEPDLRVISRG